MDKEVIAKKHIENKTVYEVYAILAASGTLFLGAGATIFLYFYSENLFSRWAYTFILVTIMISLVLYGLVKTSYGAYVSKERDEILLDEAEKAIHVYDQNGYTKIFYDEIDSISYENNLFGYNGKYIHYKNTTYGKIVVLCTINGQKNKFKTHAVDDVLTVYNKLISVIKK